MRFKISTIQTINSADVLDYGGTEGVIVKNREDLKKGDRVTALPISPCDKCPACLSGNHQYCPETWSKAVGLALTNPGGYAEYTSCRPDLVKIIPELVNDVE